MKKIIFLAILFFLFSCSINKKEILGKYDYKGIDTTDSLIIKENIYIHKIFNKQGKLMYHGESTWEFEKNRIIFFNFYDNEGYDLKEFLTEGQAKKFLTRISCPIYKNNQNIMIEVNADENIIYLKKDNK
ncbi:hypothetical protein D1632_16505 [Chryseobacterium nematophagum]|uniref:META domain-containing protein n=1 Tax=Chryseobacterium nematophagum TaxID=2305228 RepID=A0A3M7L5C9_9FLAO|nr:hypothetical protein [Chryseobacterium nematophagum]RMZ57911.1 hypothetical protein D1632_16505 [Chryseobacterium nematophagum]